MGFVLIRRFRSGEGPATSRVFHTEKEARVAARTWADEGWEVEYVVTARGDRQTVKVTTPPAMPPRPGRI